MLCARLYACVCVCEFTCSFCFALLCFLSFYKQFLLLVVVVVVTHKFHRRGQTGLKILIEGKGLKTRSLFFLRGGGGHATRGDTTQQGTRRLDDTTARHDGTTRHGTTRRRLATGNGQRATGDRQLGRKTGPPAQNFTHSLTHTHTQTDADQVACEGVASGAHTQLHPLFARRSGGEFSSSSSSSNGDTPRQSLSYALSLSLAHLFVLS